MKYYRLHIKGKGWADGGNSEDGVTYSAQSEGSARFPQFLKDMLDPHLHKLYPAESITWMEIKNVKEDAN